MTKSAKGHNEAVPTDRSTKLASLIRTEIETNGPLPVSRWMELALYHPEFGYYRRGDRDPFGTHGDFFTAEQLNPFASMLAATAARLGDSFDPFSILELGAGRRDLRDALAAWNYKGHDWHAPSLPATHSGLILANEFFDALPVRALRRNTGGWEELAVNYQNGLFNFTRAPWRTASPLLTYADVYGALLPVGSVLEVNEGITTWIADIGQRLRSGRLLVFDYGYTARELPRLGEGTLMSYRRHVALDDILQSPGDQDITAHVNFDELIRQAELNRLHLKSNLTLRAWALQIWNEEELERRWNLADARWRMQWKQLVFGMGDTFRVLEFSKE